MTVGFRTRNVSAERLRYIRALGVTDVFPVPAEFDDDLDAAKDPDRTDPEPDEHLVVGPESVPGVEEIEALRERIEAAGLRFAGLHTVFPSLYEPIAFDGPARERRLAEFTDLVENLGAAGVPVLGYQWNFSGVGRTSTRELRGGAEGTAFELAEYDGPAGDAEAETETRMWEHYREFLEAVLPTAEAAGVQLALHPADPPVVGHLEELPRLFRDLDALEDALALVDSPSHGLKLCLGCVAEMGENVPEAIRRFDGEDIVFVHFRDVAGSMPAFHETFVDEGSYDGYEALAALEAVGFEGALLADHVPRMEGDSRWGHRARGFTAGYLRGLLDAAASE